MVPLYSLNLGYSVAQLDIWKLAML